MLPCIFILVVGIRIIAHREHHITADSKHKNQGKFKQVNGYFIHMFDFPKKI